MSETSSEPPITAEWLTGVLRSSGALPSGSVESVEMVSSRLTLLSTVGRVAVRYSTGIAAPSHFFFKGTRPDLRPELQSFGRREVIFYRDIARRLPARLVPRCYAAELDETTGYLRLLLEDLSQTHALVTEWPVAPTAAQCRSIMEVYARFHACFWDHPNLGTAIGQFASETVLANHLERYERRYAAFADHLGDRLSADRRRIYDRAIGSWNRLVDRYRERRHLTLIHGDAHVWNALHSPDGEIRLIDWDDWRLDVATEDLAYMMALHWYPDRRRHLEDRMLRHYHEALLGGGVRDYSFADLREDYRRSVIGQLAVPVFQQALKLPALIWWSHLERIMLAFDDLGCEELLG